MPLFQPGRRQTPIVCRRSVRAFTLVEMLVAMALSLLIILAVTQVFRVMGDSVLAGRAVLEMSGQLRGTADRLQKDLDYLTVPCRPWPETSSGLGYFEYFEGPFWDMGLGPMTGAGRYSESSVGDIDDVLMFTARSIGEPFRGQVLGSKVQLPDGRWALSYDPANPAVSSTIESYVAEVVWFTRFNDWNDNTYPDPGEVTLHRRTFLVTPYLDLSDPDLLALNPLQFYSAFDLSVRTTQAGGNWIRTANSLEDLSRRENRIAHNASGGYFGPPNRPFPNPFWRALLVPQGTVMTNGPDGGMGEAGVDDDGSGVAEDSLAELGTFGTDDVSLPIDVVFPGSPYGESYGNDVMLSYLLAFDVKAYDPTVPIRQSLSAADPLLPGDPGYDAAAPAPIGQGGFVDLFYARYLTASPLSVFSGVPHVRSGLIQTPIRWGTATGASTYDTWTLYYEQNGLNEDGVMGIDQGRNSLDDNNLNGIDDVLERETSPPYPVPLRGIQVRLRLLDNDTRQVRQVTVTTDFIPE